MSSSMLFAFFSLAVVLLIPPATSDQYSDVFREHAVTEPVRQHLEYKWTIKNFTLLPHKHGLCIRSPNFHTKDKNAQWIMRFCLEQGTKKATISAALHLRSGSEGSTVLQDIDGHMTVFRSGRQKAFQVFNGAAVSVDSEVQIYEYLEDTVDLLSDSSPHDDVVIIGEISMPTKILTELVESPLNLNGQGPNFNGPRPNFNGPPQNFNGPPPNFNGPPNVNRPPNFNGPQNFNGPPNVNRPPNFNGPPSPNGRPIFNGPPGPNGGPIFNGPPGPPGPNGRPNLNGPNFNTRFGGAPDAKGPAPAPLGAPGSPISTSAPPVVAPSDDKAPDSD